MASPLEALGRPLVFEVTDDDGAGLDAPAPRLGQAHRARMRALDTMQKEALVTRTGAGGTWRLASDEGEYFDGDDVAPAPLALLTAGMVCSYATAVRALAAERGVDLGEFTLAQDSYYTVSGSLLAGTMRGGALSPDLAARVAGDRGVDAATLRDLVEAATERSPVHGILTGEHPSRFALSRDGRRIERGDDADQGDAVAPPDGAAEAPDPFAVVDRDAPERDPPLLVRTGDSIEDRPAAETAPLGDYGPEAPRTDDRTLRVRANCSVAADGAKTVEMLFDNPAATIFELRSDAPPGRGGQGRAPDAASLVAAGVGFCFMTQAARYAEESADEELTDLRIVQDTHLSAGGPSDGKRSDDAGAGRAAPVETHVSVATPAGDAFAREVLDAAAEMCFAHALFGTPLDDPTVSVGVD